jgi:hypothetical protein
MSRFSIAFDGSRPMRHSSTLVLLLICCTSLPARADTTIVKTSAGNGADAEVRKNANEPLSGHDTGHGDDEDLNVRYDPAPGRERNEIVFLRFDLSDVKPKDIVKARLELTAFSAFHKNRLQVYGLRHEVENQNWDEATIKFSTAPALKWNLNDLTSRDLVEEDTIKLGVLEVPRPDAGMVFVFTSEPLARFLRDPARSSRASAPNLVTLILMLDVPSRGQRRFCSKEFADEDDANAPRLVLLTR